MAKLKLKSKKNKTVVNHFLLKSRIAEHMQRGLTLDDAVKLLGITKSTLGVLRSDPEFEEFIDQCSIRCEDQHLENISSAGQSQWQASAWILERKFPEKYGKKDTVRHEYELKIHAFQKMMIDVINSLPAEVRVHVMRKLRSANIEAVVSEIQAQEIKLLSGE